MISRKKIILICFALIESLTMVEAQNNSQLDSGELLKISANKGKGFNYEYFLFIPKGIEKNKTHFLLIEPNNTGFPHDDITIHEKKARFLAIRSSIGNYVSIKLKTPLLIPIFPRPESENLVYTHALDRDAILKKSSAYERLDLQLIEMIKDAKIILDNKGYKTNKRNFMNGFSASGAFMNRFSFLHPEIIEAVAIGGINGVLMLPLKTLNGENLNYPIGLNDFHKISENKFNLKEYKRISQFIYMGQDDDNDAVKYEDAYSEDERRIIWKVLSKQMLPNRWEKCQEIYNQSDLNIIFRTYEDVGHGTPFSVLNEIVNFFRQVDDN